MGPSRSAASDDRGAIMVIALLFAVFAVAMLYSLIGTAEAIAFREGLQDDADRAALSAAVVHARSMNLIVLINIAMAALLAILVTLKLVETIALLGQILAAALAWVTAGLTLGAIPPLKSIESTMKTAYSSAKEPIFNALEVLHDTADAVKTVAPVAATGLVASEESFAAPTRMSLPVEDDTFGRLCGEAGELSGALVFLPLEPVPGLSEFRGELEDALGDLTESMSDWFCGDGSGKPPQHEHVVKHSYPVMPSAEACEASEADQADIYAKTPECVASEAEAAESEPDGTTGGCRSGTDCSLSGPYERRVAEARVQCDPAVAPAPYWYSYQSRQGHVEYEWNDKSWRRLEPRFDHPVRRVSADGDPRPPCGTAKYLVSDAYNTVVHRDADPTHVLPVCTDEQPPQLPPGPGSESRVTIDFTEVMHILGCRKSIKETIAVSDMDAADASSERTPKMLEKGITLGAEDFQIRGLAVRSSEALQAGRVVRLALWNKPDPGDPLARLRPLADFGFAQAEYFHDGTDPNEWMWDMGWRARLVRFRLPEQRDKVAEFEKLCTTSQCGDLLGTIDQLDGALAH